MRSSQFTLASSSLRVTRRVELTCLCRCCRFIVRDFTYDEDEIEKQRKDVENLLVEEKEMWVRGSCQARDGITNLLLDGTSLVVLLTPSHLFARYRLISSGCRGSTFRSCSKCLSTSRSCAPMLRVHCDMVCRRHISGLLSR